MVNKQLYYTQAAGARGQLTDGVSVSGTSTYYSVPYSGDDGDAVHCVATSTSSLTGTWTLWYSGMPNPDLADDDDWLQDTGFAPTNPAGASASFVDNTANSKTLWKRLKYVNSSGTGTIKAWVTHPSRV